MLRYRLGSHSGKDIRIIRVRDTAGEHADLPRGPQWLLRNFRNIRYDSDDLR